MADEDAPHPDMNASLARLRLFLAPHKAPKIQHDGEEDPSPPPPPITDSRTEEVVSNDEVDRQHPEPVGGVVGTEAECSGEDISVLAEQLTAAVEAEEREGVGNVKDQIDDPETPLKAEQCEEEETPEDTRTMLPPAETEDTSPALGAVASVSPISASSKEHSRIHYLLQCAMPGYHIHEDVIIWDMKNPILAAQYEENTKGLLRLESWVAVDELSAAMGDDDSTRGSGHRPGMKFTTGTIVMDPHTCKKGRKQLVLCKIAVGRSLVIHHEREAESLQLPPDYHSYYLRRQRPDATSATSEYGYIHEYILSNPLRILPQFLVRFSFSAVDARVASPCALCEKHHAVVHCKPCEAELCGSCDDEVHSANKLVSRHKRTPLRQTGSTSRSRRRSSTPVSSHDASPETRLSTDDEVKAIVSKQLDDGLASFQSTCRLHDGRKVEFFCPICAIPVCVNCKMVGDHSTGERGSHRLLTIAEAYERCLQESFKSDPLVDARRNVIDSRLQQIEKCRRDVALNREQVERAIQLQCQQALQALEEETLAKFRVLDGESLEYKRQQQQMDWLEDRLDEQRASCSVIDFLSMWNQHKMLRAELRDFPQIMQSSTAERVQADLQLVGRLQVIAGDQLDKLSSQPAAPLAIEGVNGPDTSTENSAVSSPMRRTSDHEIRQRLLSLRTMTTTDPRSTVDSRGSLARGINSETATLSESGRRLIEEMRREMQVMDGNVKTMRSVAAQARLRSMVVAPSSGPSLRTFSIQPLRRKSRNDSVVLGDGGGESPQGPGLAVDRTWSAILRQELGLSSANPASH